jgi:hypothetical protein
MFSGDYQTQLTPQCNISGNMVNGGRAAAEKREKESVFV